MKTQTKSVKIGIMSRDRYRARTIAIAKGEYKPKSGEPKIWFESLKSAAQILSQDNQELLKMIARHKPESIAELETLSHRAKPNLHRTLKTMERYGIVELKKSNGRVKPCVRASSIRLEYDMAL